MIRQSIAKRYAKGLFAVGEKDGRYKVYLEELGHILALFEGNEKLRKALMLPLLEVQQRKELLSDILRLTGVSVPLSNMLTLLVENNRMTYLPFIRDVYGELVDDKEGRIRGTIWSAYPLEGGLKTRIEQTLRERFHKKEVVLATVEDKSLIGGVRVNVKGTIIDGSVKRQLETLKENILKE
ncbi:ATP synthase F1 subunit delta [Syntrophorhabdus aromaticivorans]|uniref:ATP synthase subunit delta n=1 Tax=Syntrophorhabdus aromaticivorans TaxID=328301 RepID=A0A351U264_9BACT|nr:ATP synthase F1 subunit delta [Syntrophorhabdus aromaticivorans]NLW36915.1 ATP synthase F1 subunit delta [Syntrophorhabdus aromaticivorans]HBA54045.1 ATP synthase F1 subunit delta [Syntrophorhabdus aromaticivorans]